MSESIYFLNDEQELLKVCGESKIIESIQSKEITADKSELMNDTLSVSVLDDKKIRDAAFMAVRENDDSFSMYKITDDSDQIVTDSRSHEPPTHHHTFVFRRSHFGYERDTHRRKQ